MKKLKPDKGLLDEDLLDWDAHIETPPKKSGAIKVKIKLIETELEKAAKRCACTGDRKDLQKYLRLRRIYG